jgi:hypothetical protein
MKNSSKKIKFCTKNGMETNWSIFNKNLSHLESSFYGSTMFHPLEDLIAQNAAQSYLYSTRILNSRFLAGEESISQDPFIALSYFYHFCNDTDFSRFPEAEPLIALDKRDSMLYASLTGERFILGEAAIAKDCDMAMTYALSITKQRFIEAEPLIFNKANPVGCLLYVKMVGEVIPEAEDAICRDPKTSLEYAKTVLKGRFPEGEDSIATDLICSFDYAQDVLKGRFPQGEDIISTSARASYMYAKHIIKDRFIPGEVLILKNKSLRSSYIEFLQDKSGSDDLYLDLLFTKKF